jgi:hypothetical protein
MLYIYLIIFILQQHKTRTNTFDVPHPDPSGQHTIHIELPLIRDLISSKLNQLPSRHRLGFIEKLSHYDTRLVIRAESGDNEDGYDMQKTTTESDDILPQTAG